MTIGKSLDRAVIIATAGSLLLWVILQILFIDRFIYHDSWKHGFPMFYRISQETTCWGLPTWFGRVDSGSPLIIQTISLGVTQLVRLVAIYAAGCLRLDLISALYLYKVHLIVSYLLMAGGMFVLGSVLFKHRLSALYLLVSTLYAGMFLDALHSSQIIAILFWMPWIAIATLQCHRHFSEAQGAWYLNTAILLVCVQALDQYPHYVVLPVALGALLYLLLWPERVKELFRRLLPKLWPAAIAVTITGVQLWVFRAAILEYKPSLREGLIVNPRLFGETGFVQPTALIGMLLPLGFLAGFDDLGNSLLHRLGSHLWLKPLRWTGGVSRAFIFRLDALLFAIGFIPLLFAVLFAIRGGDRKRRIWWLAFTITLFLVSLQQSGLYLLLFHLPFFNVFRIYFLYVVVVMFAVLVMSGYGIDDYLTLPTGERWQATFRSALIVLSLTALAGVFTTWLLLDVSPQMLARTGRYLLFDGLVISLSTVVVVLAGRSSSAERWGLCLVMVVALSQSLYFVGAQKLLSISLHRVVEAYRLDEEDKTPIAAEVTQAPDLLRRKECTTFAQCYASLRDVVSFHKDLEGTFLRAKEEAVFQDALGVPVVKALSGLTHPIFWVSRRAVPYENREEMIAGFSAHQRDISDYLRQVVYVRRTDIERIGLVRSTGVDDYVLTGLRREPDRIQLTYRAEHAAILNAAITYDRNWVAKVDGVSIPVVRGNFNGLAVPLPPGRGTVELSYRSWASRFFFYSRYLCLLAAVVVVGFLTRSVLRASRQQARPMTLRG